MDGLDESGWARTRRRFRRSRITGGLAGLLVATGGLAAADSAYGVAGGTPAADGEYAFVAHVEVGTFVRACTGALIDPEWVITATARTTAARWARFR